MRKVYKSKKRLVSVLRYIDTQRGIRHELDAVIEELEYEIRKALQELSSDIERLEKVAEILRTGSK